MTTEYENAADELESLSREVDATPGKPSKIKLEKMRGLAIDCFNQIERLETRVAYLERDGRETYRTIKLLQEAGLIDEDQYSAANNLVIEARGPNNTYTDVDTILKRNRANMKKEQSK